MIISKSWRAYYRFGSNGGEYIAYVHIIMVNKMYILGCGIAYNFGTCKASISFFCMHIEHGKYFRVDDKLSQTDRGRDHVTIIYIFGSAA